MIGLLKLSKREIFILVIYRLLSYLLIIGNCALFGENDVFIPLFDPLKGSGNISKLSGINLDIFSQILLWLSSRFFADCLFLARGLLKMCGLVVVADRWLRISK